MPPSQLYPFFDYSEDKEFHFSVTRASAKNDLAVVWGGREVLPGLDPFIEHQNPPWAFIKYSVRGEGIYRFDGDRVRIKPGMVFWSGPKAWSRLEPAGDAPLVNYVVLLVGHGLKRLFCKFLHAQAGFSCLVCPEEVEATMTDLMVEGLGASDHRVSNCISLMEVLLRRIDSNMESRMKPKRRAHTTYWECKRYIEAHFETVRELGEVAGACNVTVPYICRLFDQFDTHGAYEYLSELKMRKAQRLLTQKKMRIKDIAAAVGYKDFKLFSRNYKLHFKHNASSYRKLHT